MSLTVRGPGMSVAGLQASQTQFERASSRLSSGLRITSAADDAAGLAISEGLFSRQRGSAMALRNVSDGISLLQTAEGGLGAITSMLQRARDLSVQAASTGSMSDSDRAVIAAEIGQLVAEIDRTAATTTFNGQRLLDGSRLGGFSFQVGAESGDTLRVAAVDVRGQTLGLRGTTVVTASTSTTAPSTYVTTSATFGTLDTTGPGHRDRFEVSVDGVSSGHLYLPQRVYGLADHGHLVTDLNALLTPVGVTASITGSGTGSAQLTFTAAGGNTVELLFSGQVANALGITTQETVGSTTLSAGTSSTTATLAELVAGGSQHAIGVCDAALARVLDARAQTGALQNRMEHRLSVLATTEENLASARSRIADADMALEWSGLVRAQLLASTGSAVQAQAMSGGQRVVQLLGAL